MISWHTHSLPITMRLFLIATAFLLSATTLVPEAQAYFDWTQYLKRHISPLPSRAKPTSRTVRGSGEGFLQKHADTVSSFNHTTHKDWITHTDKSVGVSIAYPEGWRLRSFHKQKDVKEIAKEQVVFQDIKYHRGILAVGSSAAKGSTPKESIDIDIQEYTDPPLTDQNLHTMRYLRDLTIETKEETVHKGLTAHILTGTFKAHGKKWKLHQLRMADAHTVYILHTRVKEGEYERMLPYFDTFAASFALPTKQSRFSQKTSSAHMKSRAELRRQKRLLRRLSY